MIFLKKTNMLLHSTFVLAINHAYEKKKHFKLCMSQYKIIKKIDGATNFFLQHKKI